MAMFLEKGSLPLVLFWTDKDKAEIKVKERKITMA